MNLGSAVMILFFALLCLEVDFVAPRLVIDASKLNEVTAELIRKEAEVVEVKKIPNVWKGKKCDGVEEQQTVYKFYIVGDNQEETEQTVEVSELLPPSRKEVISSSNEKQLWMVSTVTLWTELNCLEQDDKELLAGLKEEYLQPPSYEGYNRTMISVPLRSLPFKYSSYQYSQYGQDVFLDKYVFKQSVKEGYFVEAGAVNGVLDSNSLLFELRYNWTGLLVEANPANFPNLAVTGRKAWVAPVCLSLVPHAQFASFTEDDQLEGGMAGLVPTGATEGKRVRELQCFPLYSLLLAVKAPTVNLLVLDIEGAEFQVLKEFPWSLAKVEVILVELEHAGKVFPGTRWEVHDFLLSVGYEYSGSLGGDDIFIRKELNTPERYGLARSIEELEQEEEGLFKMLYTYGDNRNQVPNEETWRTEEVKVEKRQVDKNIVEEKLSSRREEVEFENMFHIYKNVKREDL